VLESKHFISRAYGAVFEACIALHARGLIPSVVDVAAEMERATWLQMFAHRDQDLTALVAGCAVLPPALLRQRANTLIELWRGREAIRVAQQIAARGYAGDAASELVSSALESFSAIAPIACASDVTLYGDALSAPLLPIEWLCPALKLTPGAHTAVAGNAFAGKSLAWQDVTLAIASGTYVWGVYRCRRGRALWADWDGQGLRVSQERFQRLARARGVDLRELGKALGYIRKPKFFLDEEGASDKLQRLLDGIDLFVIDSWRGATPNTNEWSRADVQRVGATLEAASSATGCVIIVIDHNVKPSRESGSGSRSSMHDVHGSTAKTEIPQSHFVFTGEEGQPLTHVEHKKERVTGLPITPFALRFEDVADEHDPRWGLRVVHRDREQLDKPSGKPALERIVERVRECIQKNPGVAGKDAVRKIVGGGQNDVRTAVDMLLARGEIVDRRIPGIGQGRCLYLTPMAPSEVP